MVTVALRRRGWRIFILPLFRRGSRAVLQAWLSAFPWGAKGTFSATLDRDGMDTALPFGDEKGDAVRERAPGPNGIDVPRWSFATTS